MIVIALAFGLLVGASRPQPLVEAATLAILPPVTDQPEAHWLGYALAEDLEARILDFSVLDKGTLRDDYPLSLLGWRQTRKAAQQVGIDTSAFLSEKAVKKVATAVGATAVFTATYWVKSSSVKVIWRMVGGSASSGLKHEQEIQLDSVSSGIERMFVGIVCDLSLHTRGIAVAPLPIQPLEALRAYGEALAISSEQSLDFESPLVLSVEQLNAAEALLSKAVMASPRFQRAWTFHSILNALRGERNRAMAQLEEAGKCGPDDSPAMALDYFLLNYREDSRKAVAKLGAALNTHPGFLQGWGNLGQAYLRAGLPREALRSFEVYRKRAPNNLWAAVMYSESLAAAGSVDEATKELKLLRKKFPDSAIVSESLAKHASCSAAATHCSDERVKR